MNRQTKLPQIQRMEISIHNFIECNPFRKGFKYMRITMILTKLMLNILMTKILMDVSSYLLRGRIRLA